MHSLTGTSPAIPINGLSRFCQILVFRFGFSAIFPPVISPDFKTKQCVLQLENLKLEIVFFTFYGVIS